MCVLGGNTAARAWWLRPAALRVRTEAQCRGAEAAPRLEPSRRVARMATNLGAGA